MPIALHVVKDVTGFWAWVWFSLFRVLPYLSIIGAFIYTLMVSKTARPTIPVPNQSGNKIQLIAATVVFLAALALQHALTNRMWNSLRWKMGTKATGIPYLSFLVLGPSTTTWGLVEVLRGDIFETIYSKLQRLYFYIRNWGRRLAGWGDNSRRSVGDSGIRSPEVNRQIPGDGSRTQQGVSRRRTVGMIVIAAFIHTKTWLTSYKGLAFLR